MFEFIQDMYRRGRYGREKLATYVPLFLTPEEYQAITGEAYREGEGDA